MIRTLILFVVSLVLVAQAAPEKRIYHGQVSDFVPYMVNIFAWNSNYNTGGGGSFVSSNHVLTSGKMIHGFTGWYASYGSEDYFNLLQSGVAWGATHPDYEPDTLKNDIGILYLQNVLSDYMEYVALPIFFLNTPQTNDVGEVHGFGAQSMDPFEKPFVLLESQQRVISGIDCQALLGSRAELVTTSHFCALDDGTATSVCLDDIGSGFVVEIEGVPTIVGVTSFYTNMCHPEYPSVYTQLTFYITWIQEILALVEPPTPLEP